MKLFDVIGGLVVVGWLAVIINVGWTTYAPQNVVAVADAKMQLTEGESWMLLRRDGKEIGFVHETRTNLDKDWLFEYTLFINVNPIGAVKSEIKSMMGSNGVIRNVKASTNLGTKKITLEAKVEGTKVELTSNLEQMNRTLNLKKAPKLSTHVYRSLASAEKLKPGDIYKEEFFDAVSLGMSELVFEFVEETSVDLYGEKVPARHFVQKIAGNELDVYIDQNGEVVIQEFPFEIVASRVAPIFGRSRARAMRTAKAEDREGVELELGSAFFDQKKVSQFLVSGISEKDGLSLASHSQHLLRWTKDGAIVDTASMRSVNTLSPEEEALALAATPRVDFQSEIFNFAAISSTHKVLPIAKGIVKQVYEKMKVSPIVAPLPASTVWANGEGDCTEYAIVTVAALRRSGLPTRFVYGVKADDSGKFISHQWVEYWDGKRFIEFDPTEKSGEVQSNTIRLFSSHLPESPKILDLLGRVKVAPYDSESQANQGEDADFN